MPRRVSSTRCRWRALASSATCSGPARSHRRPASPGRARHAAARSPPAGVALDRRPARRPSGCRAERPSPRASAGPRRSSTRSSTVRAASRYGGFSRRTSETVIGTPSVRSSRVLRQPAARPALDEAGRKGHLPDVAARDRRSETSTIRTASKPIRWIGLVDGGQRRLAERRLRDVVEPDHGQVLGHRQAERARDGDRLDRRRVVRREDRGRTVVARRAARARPSRGGLRRDSPRHGRARRRTRCRPSRARVGSPARRSRADSRSRRPARNPIRRWPRPIRYSVAVTRAAQVVGVDGRQRRRPRRCGRPRRAARDEVTSTLLGVTRIAAVGQRADPGERAPLPSGLVLVAAAVGEDDEVVARPAQAACGALQQLGVERLDVRDEHPDHVRAPAAQALCDEARRVAELARSPPGRAPTSARRRRSGR